MNAEKDPGRKEYQAAYRLKNGGKVRARERAYYRRHRKEILARKKSRAAETAGREWDVLPEDWKITFIRTEELWSWRAEKNGRVLENGKFAALKEARRDCAMALGE